MAPTHVFVDTNVFLSFYAFASDDIEQLKKLEGLIESNTLKLYVSSQVADEFWRNRETKLAKSIDDFAAKGSTALPRFLVNMPEAEDYRTALKELEKSRNKLVQKARDDAASISLSVDNLVMNLMEKAGLGAITPTMIDKARLRRDVGNPPGKMDTLGDQINWEYLLETVTEGATLHIVSRDGDYQSAFKNGKPHQFLIDEWKIAKKGSLCLHKELKPFLNAHFETIKLEVDNEKTAAVNRLLHSGSFASTHSAILHLKPFLDVLNLDDVNQLVRVGLDNSQIRWIASDTDVRQFYERLLEDFKGQLDFGLESEARLVFCENEAVDPDEPDEDEEAPF